MGNCASITGVSAPSDNRSSSSRASVGKLSRRSDLTQAEGASAGGGMVAVAASDASSSHDPTATIRNRSTGEGVTAGVVAGHSPPAAAKYATKRHRRRRIAEIDGAGDVGDVGSRSSSSSASSSTASSAPSSLTEFIRDHSGALKVLGYTAEIGAEDGATGYETLATNQPQSSEVPATTSTRRSSSSRWPIPSLEDQRLLERLYQRCFTCNRCPNKNGRVGRAQPLALVGSGSPASSFSIGRTPRGVVAAGGGTSDGHRAHSSTSPIPSPASAEATTERRVVARHIEALAGAGELFEVESDIDDEYDAALHACRGGESGYGGNDGDPQRSPEGHFSFWKPFNSATDKQSPTTPQSCTAAKSSGVPMVSSTPTAPDVGKPALPSALKKTSNFGGGTPMSPHISSTSEGVVEHQHRPIMPPPPTSAALPLRIQRALMDASTPISVTTVLTRETPMTRAEREAQQALELADVVRQRGRKARETIEEQREALRKGKRWGKDTYGGGGSATSSKKGSDKRQQSEGEGPPHHEPVGSEAHDDMLTPARRPLWAPPGRAGAAHIPVPLPLPPRGVVVKSTLMSEANDADCGAASGGVGFQRSTTAKQGVEKEISISAVSAAIVSESNNGGEKEHGSTTVLSAKNNTNVPPPQPQQAHTYYDDNGDDADELDALNQMLADDDEATLTLNGTASHKGPPTAGAANSSTSSLIMNITSHTANASGTTTTTAAAFASAAMAEGDAAPASFVTDGEASNAQLFSGSDNNTYSGVGGGSDDGDFSLTSPPPRSIVSEGGFGAVATSLRRHRKRKATIAPSATTHSKMGQSASSKSPRLDASAMGTSMRPPTAAQQRNVKEGDSTIAGRLKGLAGMLLADDSPTKERAGMVADDVRIADRDTLVHNNVAMGAIALMMGIMEGRHRQKAADAPLCEGVGVNHLLRSPEVVIRKGSPNGDDNGAAVGDGDGDADDFTVASTDDEEEDTSVAANPIVPDETVLDPERAAGPVKVALDLLLNFTDEQSPPTKHGRNYKLRPAKIALAAGVVPNGAHQHAPVTPRLLSPSERMNAILSPTPQGINTVGGEKDGIRVDVGGLPLTNTSSAVPAVLRLGGNAPPPHLQTAQLRCAAASGIVDTPRSSNGGGDGTGSSPSSGLTASNRADSDIRQVLTSTASPASLSPATGTINKKTGTAALMEEVLQTPLRPTKTPARGGGGKADSPHGAHPRLPVSLAPLKVPTHLAKLVNSPSAAPTSSPATASADISMVPPAAAVPKFSLPATIDNASFGSDQHMPQGHGGGGAGGMAGGALSSNSYSVAQLTRGDSYLAAPPTPTAVMQYCTSVGHGRPLLGVSQSNGGVGGIASASYRHGMDGSAMLTLVTGGGGGDVGEVSVNNISRVGTMSATPRKFVGVGHHSNLSPFGPMVMVAASPSSHQSPQISRKASGVSLASHESQQTGVATQTPRRTVVALPRKATHTSNNFHHQHRHTTGTSSPADANPKPSTTNCNCTMSRFTLLQQAPLILSATILRRDIQKRRAAAKVAHVYNAQNGVYVAENEIDSDEGKPAANTKPSRARSGRNKGAKKPNPTCMSKEEMASGSSSAGSAAPLRPTTAVGEGRVVADEDSASRPITALAGMLGGRGTTASHAPDLVLDACVSNVYEAAGEDLGAAPLTAAAGGDNDTPVGNTVASSRSSPLALAATAKGSAAFGPRSAEASATAALIPNDQLDAVQPLSETFGGSDTRRGLLSATARSGFYGAETSFCPRSLLPDDTPLNGTVGKSEAGFRALNAVDTATEVTYRSPSADASATNTDDESCCDENHHGTNNRDTTERAKVYMKKSATRRHRPPGDGGMTPFDEDAEYYGDGVASNAHEHGEEKAINPNAHDVKSSTTSDADIHTDSSASGDDGERPGSAMAPRNGPRLRAFTAVMVDDDEQMLHRHDTQRKLSSVSDEKGAANDDCGATATPHTTDPAVTTAACSEQGATVTVCGEAGSLSCNLFPSAPNGLCANNSPQLAVPTLTTDQLVTEVTSRLQLLKPSPTEGKALQRLELARFAEFTRRCYIPPTVSDTLAITAKHVQRWMEAMAGGAFTATAFDEVNDNTHTIQKRPLLGGLIELDGIVAMERRIAIDVLLPTITAARDTDKDNGVPTDTHLSLYHALSLQLYGTYEHAYLVYRLLCTYVKAHCHRYHVIVAEVREWQRTMLRQMLAGVGVSQHQDDDGVPRPSSPKQHTVSPSSMARLAEEVTKMQANVRQRLWSSPVSLGAFDTTHTTQYDYSLLYGSVGEMMMAMGGDAYGLLAERGAGGGRLIAVGPSLGSSTNAISSATTVPTAAPTSGGIVENHTRVMLFAAAQLFGVRIHLAEVGEHMRTEEEVGLGSQPPPPPMISCLVFQPRHPIPDPTCGPLNDLLADTLAAVEMGLAAPVRGHHAQHDAWKVPEGLQTRPDGTTPHQDQNVASSPPARHAQQLLAVLPRNASTQQPPSIFLVGLEGTNAFTSVGTRLSPKE